MKKAKCRKPVPNIFDHVDNHHKVAMIELLTQKEWYKHEDDVLIMTWNPCICVLAYRKLLLVPCYLVCFLLN
jgi:hypothetical protein